VAVWLRNGGFGFFAPVRVYPDCLGYLGLNYVTFLVIRGSNYILDDVISLRNLVSWGFLIKKRES
jgi:hypothetical protein